MFRHAAATSNTFLVAVKAAEQQIDAPAEAAEADGLVYSRIVFKPLLAASSAAVQLEFVYTTTRYGTVLLLLAAQYNS